MKKKVIAAIALALYAWVWGMTSTQDRYQCERHGVAYAGTTLGLDGYCEIGSAEVPAYSVGYGR